MAIARVIGETAPLLLTAVAFTFSRSPYPSGIIQNPIRAMPFEVFYNLLFTTNQLGVQWALNTSIVLIALVILLNIMAYFARKVIRAKYAYHGQL